VARRRPAEEIRMSFSDRIDYGKDALDPSAVLPDPISQFHRWFDDAIRAGIPEPNAMTLATATPGGVPSARIVLLKGVDPRGFVFFTDYRSQKGQELGANPAAALVFFWQPLERQVRISGTVGRTTPAESAEYFDSRPLGSRLGAWTSRQSAILESRAALDAAYAETERRFDGKAVPCPAHWGGFRLTPVAVEFWQGRRSRLHDRVRYRNESGQWVIERLSP
jgi:pyridoxamine 5'-phosphate oxidase